MTNKIWYIQVDGKKEGPYNIRELKKHPRVNPNTLVWKEGFKDWIPACYVPELKTLFEEKEEEEEESELKDRLKLKTTSADDSSLAIEGSNFPFLTYWLIILLILLSAYLFNQMQRF